MDRDLIQEISELIRLTSTDLPRLVEERLRLARDLEAPSSAARAALDAILENVALARSNSTPICQDTGTPIFFVNHSAAFNANDLTRQIRQAVELATKNCWLRPNAVNPLNGVNTATNLGDKYFPAIHFNQVEENTLTIDLILNGGGCENVGAQYSLPDTRLDAGRDLEGVRKAVLDAVQKAQGEGCAPGFLGVAIGGDRGTSYTASKEAFLCAPEETNPDEVLQKLEERITGEANQLGIGPMGFGGNTTVLDTRITSTYRLPASFFVTVSFMCWAYRHRQMVVTGDQVAYN